MQRNWHSYVTFAPTLISALFVVGAAAAQEPLDQLLRVYQDYELPSPPESAQLSIVQYKDADSEDRRSLVFIEETSDPQNKLWIWIGCERVRLDPSLIWHPCPPNGKGVSQTTPMDEVSESEGFRTFPDVALAIQCQQRGWHELSAALWTRAQAGYSKNLRDPAPRVPRHDREALLFLAWNHWSNEFVLSTADRGKIVDRLRKLNEDPLAANIRGHNELVADMTATLESKPGADGLEADVEALLDFGSDLAEPYQLKTRFVDLEDAVSFDRHYDKLQQAGLDAVPVLIEHLHDYRLTRCVESILEHHYTWHVRISDVVAVLLSGLADEELSHDFLAKQGRGIALDKDHVHYWYAEVQKVSTLDYLLSHAITLDEDGDPNVNLQILYSLGSKHPEDFVALFERELNELKNTRMLFVALGTSRVDSELKYRLLLQAAHHTSLQNRDFALRQLLRMQHPDAQSLLIAEIEAIPQAVGQEHELSPARTFSALVCRTEDQRVWEALLEKAKRVDVGQRLEMLDAVSEASDGDDPRALDFLSAFLDDETVRVLKEPENQSDDEDLLGRMPSPPTRDSYRDSSHYIDRYAGSHFQRLAVRDCATLLLANELELEDVDGSQINDEDWPAIRDRVREALKNHKVEAQPAEANEN